MKTKIFGFAVMLSLATLLGACGGGAESTDTSTPAAPGEPVEGTTGTPTPASTPTNTP